MESMDKSKNKETGKPNQEQGNLEENYLRFYR